VNGERIAHTDGHVSADRIRAAQIEGRLMAVRDELRRA
jgi:hypothetical protein